MTTFRDALLALERRATEQWEPTRQIIRAEIVAQDGSVNVSGRPGFVWVKSDDRPGGRFQVFNPTVQAREGMPVILGFGKRPPARLQILSVDWTLLPGITDYDGDPYLANHASSHEMPDGAPGPDAIHVYQRSIVPLKTYGSSSLTVDVAPLRYDYLGVVTTFPGHYGLDLSSHQPASGSACYVLVYLDTADNTAKSTAGSTTGDSPGYNPSYPTVPVNAIPSALVRLDGDQTTITEADIVDARQLFNRVGLDGSGWPFETECATVDSGDIDADYDSITDALAGSSERMILLSPEQYTETVSHTLNADQLVRGMGVEKTHIYTSTPLTFINTADGSDLEDLTITNERAGSSQTEAIYIGTADTVDFRRVRFIAGNTTADAYAIAVAANATALRLWNCYTESTAGGDAYGLYIDDAAVTGPTVRIYGGQIGGDDYGIYAGNNCSLYLYGPVIPNGIDAHSGADVYGWWYDADGDLQSEGATTLTMTDGDLYFSEGHTAHQDGETAQYTSLWERKINLLGTTVWTTHFREGSGTPTGFDGWVTTPSSIYVTYDGSYTDYQRSTWFRGRPNHATLRCWLASYSASPIANTSSLYARMAATSGSELGLRADNFDSDRSYNVNDRLYYYEIYIYGSSPVTQIGYRHGYFTWDGAAWTGPTESTGGPTTIGPLGMEVVLRVYINYGASNNSCAGYLLNEVVAACGSYGGVSFYVDAVPNPLGAHRAGLFWRLNTGFANSSFDWAYLSWV